MEIPVGLPDIEAVQKDTHTKVFNDILDLLSEGK